MSDPQTAPETAPQTASQAAPATAPAAAGAATARKTEQLDEAIACLRNYGRQNAVDTRALETAIRTVRSRIASRVPERELAGA